MSSPSTPKASPAKPASPSPLSSPETPRPLRTFSRAPPVDLGDRLANARNLRPDDAPPPPSPQASFPAFGGGVMMQAPVHSAIGPALDHKVGPMYGGVPGSYISPYDTGGKAPGDKHLLASTMTEAEFERKYGSFARRGTDAQSQRTIISPGGVVIPVTTEIEAMGILEKLEMERLEKEKKAGPPSVPSGAKDRLVLLGPFRLIKKACASKADTKGYAEMSAWLDAHMHEELHKVVVSDEVLPEVVYAVHIPMTDTDWKFYNDALAMCFPEALELHNALATGYDAMDHFTDSHEFAKAGFPNEQSELTKDALTMPDKTKEEMLTVMVKQHRLSLPWDYGRPVQFRPDLVPEELGGKLKGYQE
ncbi:hypothetical protein FB567DRAFT_478243 [Paraphoma chrysanthemicola]|uniref:Uncharacterized protein n=1 Tax=Paraphoma chrysanthemicola TaxID=798071 RepID=A0A8K0QXV0_9PLEO|nr:hypothetical protein FB567DRAFT_478243 [Paraphoma chrysanthemicola]